MQIPVFRFAPSPNGELHLGHALSALTGFELARRLGGRFLLRIEDIDLERSRPQFTQGIYDDLAWLGLSWEEPVLVQSQHFAEYLAAADALIAKGLLYPCFATRSEVAAAADPAQVDPDGAPLYPGLWKAATPEEVQARFTAGETPAMRIDVQKAFEVYEKTHPGVPLTFIELGHGVDAQVIAAEPTMWGDAVIVRKDVPASYHLAVVVDDARQGITHVTRGEDLFAATHLHRLLQALLGLPAPVYCHHRLIAGDDGRKLSKSARDTSLRSLRDDGATAADIRRLVGLA